MRNLIFCFGLTLCMLGCKNAEVASKQTKEMNSYEILYMAEYGGAGEDETRIIETQDDFARYWAEVTHQPPLSAAKFDSNQKMIITKSFPSRNSGGNEYKINSIKQTGNTIQVHYTIIPPKDMATMAITNPLMILLVDKVEKPQIEFILE